MEALRPGWLRAVLDDAEKRVAEMPPEWLSHHHAPFPRLGCDCFSCDRRRRLGEPDYVLRWVQESRSAPPECEGG